MFRKRLYANSDKFVIIGIITSIGLLVFSIICFVTSLRGETNSLFLLLAGRAFVIDLYVILAVTVFFFINNQFYNGRDYGIAYAKIAYNLRRNLIDADYYELDCLNNIKLPKIYIELSEDLSEGTIKISNSIHFDKALEKENISSALGEYVIDRSYLSNDQNFYVYEIYDYKTLKSKEICSYFDFKDFANEEDDYHLRLDDHNSIKTQSMLVVGQTGSGKTYELYNLLLQMRLKKNDYQFYFADPKRSSLYVLGRNIKLEQNSYEINDIIESLRDFHTNMMKRAEDMVQLLETKIDSNYSDYNLSPYIFVFDEYASFNSSLQLLTKDKRDEVNSILRDIVLMGRQLGFFIIIVMQKSDSTTLPTMIRDNLPLKIVLGNAEDTTYITAFGNGIEIPKHQFKTGEGIYTCSGSVNTPKFVTVPTLNFDILDGFIASKYYLN